MPEYPNLIKKTINDVLYDSAESIHDKAPYPIVDLIAALCIALREKGITYCHWKSNAVLDRSASGENDLDLLVERSDSQRFIEILNGLGFKECLIREDKKLPGVQDYFGYDSIADKFIHVHVHYRLVLGHDLTKNYHIPVEKPYLKSRQRLEHFDVPDPAFEYVIFVIRMIIKHSTFDTILMRQGSLSKSEKQELIYLEEKADPERVAKILELYLPFIEVRLFNECVQAIHPNCSFFKRIKAGWRLQNRLKLFAQRNLINDLATKFWRRFYYAFERRLRKTSLRYRLPHFGIIVAILGGDGAGKTTIVDELDHWLSRILETKKIHLGKPTWSKTTIVVRGLLKIGNFLHLYPFEKAPVLYNDDDAEVEFPGYPWLIRQVCSARDRTLTYHQAMKFTLTGGIVISDRYPLQQIKFMENPYVSRRMTESEKDNRIVKWLLKLEEKFFQQILPPEILIALLLDPEIAVQRKFDESAESVRARTTEIWELDWLKSNAIIIDASQSKAEVLSKLKALVWAQL